MVDKKALMLSGIRVMAAPNRGWGNILAPPLCLLNSNNNSAELCNKGFRRSDQSSFGVGPFQSIAVISVAQLFCPTFEIKSVRS